MGGSQGAGLLGNPKTMSTCCPLVRNQEKRHSQSCAKTRVAASIRRRFSPILREIWLNSWELNMATWQDGTCNEKSGFLFKHECFQLPTSTCQACGKPICEDHSHELPDGTFCTSCARGQIKRPVAPAGQSAKSGDSTRNVDRDEYHYHNDPYLYSSSYYYGYHWGSHSSRTSNLNTSHGSSHGTSAMSADSTNVPANDPVDFTEADGGSFEAEQDEDLGGGDFENDMSES